MISSHIVEEQSCAGAEEIDMALIAATTAKNQLASVHGFCRFNTCWDRTYVCQAA